VRSKIDWTSVEHADRRQWLEFYRELLDCRRREIVPRIKDLPAGRAEYQVLDAAAVRVCWPFIQGGNLELVANFGRAQLKLEGAPHGRLIYGTARMEDQTRADEVAPLSATWFLNKPS